MTEVLAAITDSSASPEVLRAVQVLTRERVSIRGCNVSPVRAHLKALQDEVGWTIGSDPCPTPEVVEKKQRDRLELVLRYRQNEDPEAPRRVKMYDYLLDTIFGVPMRPVGEDIVVPTFQNLSGEIVTPKWMEADWNKFAQEGRPAPAFVPDQYPYQLPARKGKHPLQQQAQHWILWYFRFPDEEASQTDPGDEAIDRHVREALQAEIACRHFTKVDYIWYRNPSTSTLDLFHVLVFWIIPTSP